MNEEDLLVGCFGCGGAYNLKEYKECPLCSEEQTEQGE